MEQLKTKNRKLSEENDKQTKGRVNIHVYMYSVRYTQLYISYIVLLLELHCALKEQQEQKDEMQKFQQKQWQQLEQIKKLQQERQEQQEQMQKLQQERQEQQVQMQKLQQEQQEQIQKLQQELQEQQEQKFQQERQEQIQKLYIQSDVFRQYQFQEQEKNNSPKSLRKHLSLPSPRSTPYSSPYVCLLCHDAAVMCNIPTKLIQWLL